jgi:membrane-anchored glycerophosphoryl diester phosphodiesterase (GDPDase)
VAITNFDLADFFLSIRGLTFLFVLAVSWGAFFLAERAGLLFLAAGTNESSVGPTEALWRSLVRLPQLARLGLLYLMIFGLLLLPFAAVGAAAGIVLLGQHDINYYLYHQPREWWLALACGGVLAILYGGLALALWFRLLFAVQFVLFNKSGPRTALAQSWSLTKGRAMTLAIPLAGWWLVMWLVASVVTASVSVLGGVVLAAAGAHVWTAEAIVGFFGLVLLIISLAGRSISTAGETTKCPVQSGRTKEDLNSLQNPIHSRERGFKYYLRYFRSLQLPFYPRFLA